MLLHAHKTVVPNWSTLAVDGCELPAEPDGAEMITGDGMGDARGVGAFRVSGEPAIAPLGVDGVRLALGLAGSA